LLALQEQDETRLGITVQMMEHEDQKWGQNSLLMGKTYYSEKRRYAISGDSLAGGVWFFDRAELRNTQDVRVVPGSALPQNKYAKQETVIQMFGQGILGVPMSEEAQVRARRMLEFGLVEDLHDDDAVHEQVAEKENQAMISMANQAMQVTQGNPMAIQAFLPQIVMPVRRYDKHLIHVRNHMRRINMMGVVDNPILYEAMAIHLDQHMMALQPPPQPMVTPEAAATAGNQQEQGGSAGPQNNFQNQTPQGEGGPQLTPGDFQS
jgi:hypothetical protein